MPFIYHGAVLLAHPILQQWAIVEIYRVATHLDKMSHLIYIVARTQMRLALLRQRQQYHAGTDSLWINPLWCRAHTPSPLAKNGRALCGIEPSGSCRSSMNWFFPAFNRWAACRCTVHVFFLVWCLWRKNVFHRCTHFTRIAAFSEIIHCRSLIGNCLSHIYFYALLFALYLQRKNRFFLCAFASFAYAAILSCTPH